MGVPYTLCIPQADLSLQAICANDAVDFVIDLYIASLLTSNEYAAVYLL